jgi:type II secretory pathway pseudopilin PulG
MLRRAAQRAWRNERGGSLVEVLVAVTLLGLALVVLLGSFSTLAIASRNAERVALAQAVSRAQAARIKAAPYQAVGDYSAYYETLPAGLSRSVSTTWWDGVSAWSGSQNANGLEKLVITISGGGSTAARVEFVKANR